jgi:hypothetical protein
LTGGIGIGIGMSWEELGWRVLEQQQQQHLGCGLFDWSLVGRGPSSSVLGLMLLFVCKQITVVIKYWSVRDPKSLVNC